MIAKIKQIYQVNLFVSLEAVVYLRYINYQNRIKLGTNITRPVLVLVRKGMGID